MPNLVNSANISGRRTLLSWTCGDCGHYNTGPHRHCLECSKDRIERHANVHQSDRAVCFRHPVTGEIRRPARADEPMSPVYAAQGYVREEIMSMIQHEKETGSVHEQSNFTKYNEPMPDERFETPKAPKEVVNAIIDDWRAANQSGDWTMETPLVDGPAE